VSVVQRASAENLDRQLSAMSTAAQTLRNRPPMGWIAALRTALGMSATALAKRLGVSHATVLGYEKAELSGRIQLDTLKRVADALGADLVVALVPRTPVKEQLRDQAQRIARDELNAVVRTMQLENQKVPEDETRAQFEQLVDSLLADPKKLWR
jgi:predicted DNA-binding mobile mystery protein A